MALFKCKGCGGDLLIEDNSSVCECEYCGTKQPIPTIRDENLQNLFNRANTLRMKSEFDKAAEIYEKIIQKEEGEAEAYWGLILCRYGIEYVEDPKTMQRIPTCHRASFESVTADDDYKSALQYADLLQRRLYEEEAKKIDEIQKNILALAQKDEPYDVFICYKETDEGGKRTQDSVIANDIYYQLTQEGFKTFYAAITLEDKLGSEYEPHIFAALNTAKVMLAIGTKPEYFNAVWVKNEWSRFLAMMKKDRSKTLIPCYRDMDAYDLPEEFSHLQAQDMSKIGFINDLVRGIKKVLHKDEPAPQQSTAGANVAPLLKRVSIFLEDGNWQEADAYCEKVLDQDPENAQAYVGKLMAELKVRRQADLKNCAQPFASNDNYQKASRFADPKLKEALLGYNMHIVERNKESRYQAAAEKMRNAYDEKTYRDAADFFGILSGYKDADALAKECLEKAETCRKDAIYSGAVKHMETAADASAYQLAEKEFRTVPGYKDADSLAEKCAEQAEIARKDAIYDAACRLAEKNKVSSLEQAITEFRQIPGWKDADAKILVCKAQVEELKAQEERERIAAEKKAEEERIAAEKRAAEAAARKKKMTTIAACIAAAIALGIAAFFIITKVVIPNGKYNDAVALMNEGKYDEAIAAFEAMDGYKDSADKITECCYDAAAALMDGEKYEDAIAAFEALDGYRDSNDRIAACRTALKDIAYEAAVSLMDAGKFAEAIDAFKTLDGHRDSADLITACEYNAALADKSEGAYAEAIAAFQKLNGYQDSADQITDCYYLQANELMAAEQYAEAITALDRCAGYKDADEQKRLAEQNVLNEAITLLDSAKLDDAYSLLTAIGDSPDAKEYLEKLVYLPCSIVGNSQQSSGGYSQYGYSFDYDQYGICSMNTTPEPVEYTFRNGQAVKDYHARSGSVKEYTDNYSVDGAGNVTKTHLVNDFYTGTDKIIYTFDKDGFYVKSKEITSSGKVNENYGTGHKDTTVYQLEKDENGNVTKIIDEYQFWTVEYKLVYVESGSVSAYTANVRKWIRICVGQTAGYAWIDDVVS